MSKKNFNASYVLLRRDLVKLVRGNNLCILDVGCSTGINGKYLLENHVAKKVIGIEYNPEMASVANEIYEKVFVGNLNSEQFLDEIKSIENKFDYIICGDVLEHLLRADIVLQILKEKLNENGKIIISVPNIQHIETFIQVYINGYWPRNDRGIFDKTHVTWFTKKNLYEFIKNAGLYVKTYKPVYRGRDDVNSKLSWLQKALRINIKWFVFQHIIVCEKNSYPVQ
ncbi:MAG: class I SAM-dependent methyltransferase [Bergeyella sp.]